MVCDRGNAPILNTGGKTNIKTVIFVLLYIGLPRKEHTKLIVHTYWKSFLEVVHCNLCHTNCGVWIIIGHNGWTQQLAVADVGKPNVQDNTVVDSKTHQLQKRIVKVEVDFQAVMVSPEISVISGNETTETEKALLAALSSLSE